MTKRERVMASVRRQPVDAIPWQFDLTGAVRRKLAQLWGTDDLLAATDDHMVWTGLGTPRGYETEPVGEGLWRSEFGTVWARGSRDITIGDWGEMVSCPLSGPSLEGHDFPDGSAPGRADGIAAVREAYPEHFVVLGSQGLFEAAWALCGFERYLGYLVGESLFAAEVTERLADFACGAIAQAAGQGADGIRIGDDWGCQERLMVNPALWRRLYKEPYRRVFTAAREAGLVVMMHSCGKVWDILPDLIEVGLEVMHPLQPEAMDVAACQREFGRDLAFWGGLGSQSTLPYGSVAEVQAEVDDRLALFAGGGYILAPAGAAPADTPARNIDAVVRRARAQLG